MKQNKGTILKASVDYMKCLKKEVNKIPDLERKNRELEQEHRRMLMKLEKLEQNVKNLSYDQQRDTNDFDDNNNTGLYQTDSLTNMNFNNNNNLDQHQHEFNQQIRSSIKSNQQQQNSGPNLQLNQYIKQEYFETPTTSNLNNSNQMNSNYLPHLSNLMIENMDNFNFNNNNNNSNNQSQQQLHNNQQLNNKQSQNNSNKLLNTIKSEILSPQAMDICL